MASKNKSTRKRQKKARKARERARRHDRRVSDPQSRWGRMCGSKRAYGSKGAALAAASKASRDSRTGYLKPYLCPYCGRWHLSSHPDWGSTEELG